MDKLCARVNFSIAQSASKRGQNSLKNYEKIKSYNYCSQSAKYGKKFCFC